MTGNYKLIVGLYCTKGRMTLENLKYCSEVIRSSFTKLLVLFWSLAVKKKKMSLHAESTMKYLFLCLRKKKIMQVWNDVRVNK